jgi:hypothetical protein
VTRVRDRPRASHLALAPSFDVKARIIGWWEDPQKLRSRIIFCLQFLQHDHAVKTS